MKPERIFIGLFLTLTLAWSISGQAQSCDASPMRLSNELIALVQTDIREAQSLSSKDKAKLGYSLLLKSVNKSEMTRAYVDYFIAQMYINYPDQNQYRQILLSSAIKTEQLYGAELQDALFTLANLYQKAGDLDSYEFYLKQWQAVVCAPRFVEAKNSEKGNRKPTLPKVEKPAAVLKSRSSIDGLMNKVKEKETPMESGSPLETAPKLLKYIEPLYPPDAFDKDISGYVSLSFTITKDGFVTDVEVLKSVPENVFEHAAVDAVRQWLFRPKMAKGKAQAKVGHRIRLNFDIKLSQ